MSDRCRLQGVVALDGPSGTGKSTVARRLATSVCAGYLDTGAMYRAAALGVLRAGVDPSDPVRVQDTVRALRIEVGTDPQAPTVLLDGEDVAVEIRESHVTVAVSPVSAVAEVRVQLVAQQQELITAALAPGGGIVVEGRDIGTVVAPDAPLKVYLTAAPEIRAARRAGQDRRTDVDEVLRSVARRDHLDSTRAASPLQAAEDAVEVDTTEMDVDSVVAALAGLLEDRGLVSGAVR